MHPLEIIEVGRVSAEPYDNGVSVREDFARKSDLDGLFVWVLLVNAYSVHPKSLSSVFLCGGQLVNGEPQASRSVEEPRANIIFCRLVRLSRGVFSVNVEITPNGIAPCMRERQIQLSSSKSSRQHEEFFDPLQLPVGCNDIDLVESPPVGHGESRLQGEGVQFHQTDRPRGLQELMG
jgi:hypothetical protein